MVLIKLVDHLIQNIGLIALLVSAGVLVLVSNRDAFEIDSKPRREDDPVGGERFVWQWKYMSDHAEHARLELLHLVRVLSVITRTLLVVVFILFVVSGGLGVLQYFGYSYIAEPIEQNSWFNLAVEHILGLLFVGFAPVLLVRLARVVSHVVRARNEPEASKPPGWVAWPKSEHP